MKFRFNLLLALAAAGIAFSAATAQAVIVVGLNQIQYADREQLATYSDATHTYTAADPSLIAVGEHLYGISASTVESPNPSPPFVATTFDIVIAKIIDPTTGASIVDGTGHIIPGFTGNAEVLFTTDNAGLSSGETGGFLTGSTGTMYTLADGSKVAGQGEAANTLNAIFQGSTLTPLTLDTLANQATGITDASNGAKFGDFGLGEERFVLVLVGAFQRHLAVDRPDAHQIRLAPRGLQCRPFLAGRRRLPRNRAHHL
jgi:hypothetical protein